MTTPNAPQAIGPYSQAIKTGNMLFISGQIGIDPDSGKLVENGIEAETNQVMKNLNAILTAADFSLDDVVQTQVFLADISEYGQMNEVYASFLGDVPPARAAIQAARLPRDARVEISMIAVRTR
ncbi:MAG: RidA family protein [Dehalococcoidia bacterium]|nr:RidA family protein [Dehalococcoidia bacterium]